jgi:hypothetical protein
MVLLVESDGHQHTALMRTAMSYNVNWDHVCTFLKGEKYCILYYTDFPLKHQQLFHQYLNERLYRSFTNKSQE